MRKYLHYFVADFGVVVALLSEAGLPRLDDQVWERKAPQAVSVQSKLDRQPLVFCTTEEAFY